MSEVPYAPVIENYGHGKMSNLKLKVSQIKMKRSHPKSFNELSMSAQSKICAEEDSDLQRQIEEH